MKNLEIVKLVNCLIPKRKKYILTGFFFCVEKSFDHVLKALQKRENPENCCNCVAKKIQFRHEKFHNKAYNLILRHVFSGS